ncbi:restriction endonuclease [Sphingobium sp. B2]|uniref:restriction endonuclease n=1 Tax=Sphingobium sp. B2 TaxID=2583228 RepID=UPI0011AA7070|nr:restriction endonuclease [Sphingobium sp. B2]
MNRSELNGKKLERLVATLERTLAGTHATIESPSRRLRDRDTNKRREHDILITWDHGHHQIITAIECRDRSRPVGVPEVEAFADKCSSTGVNAGVIVSATGFRTSARAKAAMRSITCMDLTEVECFDWLAPDAVFVGYERRFGHMSVKIMFKDAQPDAIDAVFDTAGAELTSNQIIQAIANGVPQSDNPEDEVDKLIPLHMYVQTIGWTVRDNKGAIWSVDHILVDTTVTITKYLTPVQRHRYFGGRKDYAVATADTKIAGRAGTFVMVHKEDDTISLSLTFDEPIQAPQS